MERQHRYWSGNKCYEMIETEFGFIVGKEIKPTAAPIISSLRGLTK